MIKILDGVHTIPLMVIKIITLLSVVNFNHPVDTPLIISIINR